MEELKIKNLLDLNETLAAGLFEGKEYPYEVLAHIGDYIKEIGPTLSKEIFEERGEHIYIAKDVKIAPTASITGPLIIDEGTDVRQCAFIRGNAIIGKNCVVGNSTELKNVVIFNNVQVPHYNYVGDSILGHRSHMGAGSITSNVKSDKTHVAIKCNGEILDTGRKKVGAVLGDYVEIGCNSVLNPGVVIGRRSSVYPVSCVRGFVPEDSIYKGKDDIVKRV